MLMKYVNVFLRLHRIQQVFEDKFIVFFFPAGDDPKKAEAEIRQKYDILSEKFRSQFVREVISKKGTEEVSMYMLVTQILCDFHSYACLNLYCLTFKMLVAAITP